MTNLTNLVNNAIATELTSDEEIAMHELMAEQNAGLDDYMNRLRANDAVNVVAQLVDIDELTRPELTVEEQDERNELSLMENQMLNTKEQSNQLDMGFMTGLEEQAYFEGLDGTEVHTDKLATEGQSTQHYIDNINDSAFMSTMAADMFHQDLSPQLAMIISASYVEALQYWDDAEMFTMALVDGLNNCNVSVTTKFAPELPSVGDIDIDLVSGKLAAAGYLNDDGSLGDTALSILMQNTHAYTPLLASEGGVVDRQFAYAGTKVSPLFKEATHALQRTEFVVDTYMFDLAKSIDAIIAIKDEKDLTDTYVLRGCMRMLSRSIDGIQQPHVSEFKGDTRGRLYQASCHGPNGQSSDRSRSLMDLHAVDMGYDAQTAMKHLKAEMNDMVSVTGPKKAELLSEVRANPVEFIMKHVALKDDAFANTECSKPWSFVKAVRIFDALKSHMATGSEKPYIGMAFGLDAKCSGPQLGALMSGDQGIAAACGFASVDELLDDAYHGAIVECKAAGYTNELLTRAIIKKPFMGIFYGQGWMAFTKMYAVDEKGKQVNGTMSPELTKVLHGDGSADWAIIENNAKRFHAAVSKSFGSAMSFIRTACKAYGVVDGADRCDKKTSHFMPDGLLVAMNYKHKVDIYGNVIDFDSLEYDIRVVNNTKAYKFINMRLNTTTLNASDFARNGFVNMVQAIDALIARLIIVNLDRLGAQHIISVHDCFRVNVNDMHLLEKAIKMSYMQLFGTKTNVKTKDMPLGLDILGMYFDGANAALKDTDTGKKLRPSQFMDNSMQPRRLQKIKGRKLVDIIMDEKSYYFAK